jgi:predicted negative regulator of RcsB-dependent stress response
VAEVRTELGRANRRAQFEDATELHQRLCALEPLDPLHRIGLARGHMQERNPDAALEALADVEAMPKLTVSVRSRMYELRGDIELWRGALDAAAQAYDAGLALPNDEGHTRVLQLKRAASGDPALAEVVVDYLSLFDTKGDGFTQGLVRLADAHRIRALPGYAALGNYLVARQLLGVQRAADALPFLEAAHAHQGDLPSAEFRRALRYELMNASLQTRAYDRARTLLAELEAEPGIGNGHRLRYAQWRDRIAFFANARPATGRE